MTVHHIIPDNALGGGAVIPARLITALAERGDSRAHRAVLPADAAPEVRALFAGLPHLSGAYRGRDSVARFARAILALARPGDIVHAHGARPALGAAAAALLRPALRTVYTVHGFHGLAQPGPLALRARAERWLARRMDATVFVSEADAALAREAGLRHRGAAMVIGNGVSVPAPVSETSRDIDLLFVGRLVRQKRPEAFVEAVARLSRPARVVMIGAGELAGEVDSLARARGLPDFTRHDGLPRDETLARMARARLLVMTSRWEGLPTVAIEAALSGALVAGHAIPPLREILGDLAPETLTEAEPAALAARLDALLADEPRRQTLAARLRARAGSRYAPGAMAARHAELYDRLA
ncbi:MAG: glycosyltransferase family 4 protein [Pseudomonadota bacterium]